MATDNNKNRKFGSVSLPTGILEAIDALIEELRYWPSRGAFVREACLEKIRREEDRLKERKDPDNFAQLGGLKGDQPPLKPET
jgi:Arc/MetJ-type ribon-helix-helix transcriptional regulator